MFWFGFVLGATVGGVGVYFLLKAFGNKPEEKKVMTTEELRDELDNRGYHINLTKKFGDN